MNIKIKSNSKEKSVTISEPSRLIDILTSNGFSIAADCGGHGKCGKCAVKITPWTDAIPNFSESFTVLSCEYTVTGNILVELNEESGTGLLDHAEKKIVSDHRRDGFGAVLDIGTTTLAMYLVDLNSGETVASRSALNPQRKFGADVISRIEACMNGKTSELHKILVNKIAEMLSSMCKEIKIERAEMLYVTGNTTMLHLFLGEDPKGIGVFPFNPVFLDSKKVDGASLGIDVNEIATMPCIGAYLGGDAVSATLAAELDKGCNLLLDIGTNGELILHRSGKYFCASTAAGPALEGASITCGCGGINGAVNHVFSDNGRIRYTTIGDAPAVGICGCGLIDAIAVMLDNNVIDETGTFNSGEEFQIAEDVSVYDRDVREFQLAKSAIVSGIKTLLRRSGVSYEEIDNIYIAGGLGYYINRDSAVRVGLIPRELSEKVEIIGNAAALGAKLAMLTSDGMTKMDKIVSSCEVIELANDADFAGEFMANMMF